MADTIIEFNPQKQEPPRYGGWWINGFCFTAGLNSLSSKVYQQMKKTPAFVEMISLGAFSVYTPEVVPEVVEEVSISEVVEEVVTEPVVTETIKG